MPEINFMDVAIFLNAGIQNIKSESAKIWLFPMERLLHGLEKLHLILK